MSLFKCILCFKEIEKESERFLVQNKKKTIFDVYVALAIWSSMYTLHQCSFVGSVMVSSRRELICSRTWKNYKNLWESTTPQVWPCFPAEKFARRREFKFEEVDFPTRLRRFVTFVHLLFSVRSLDLFVASLVFMKGTSSCVIRRKLAVKSCYGKFL